jgi:alpha-L-fucosidase
MLKIILVGLLWSGDALSQESGSRVYTADWADLDRRPLPQWYADAKFGIFIHWGVYSVPAFCAKDEYAEWYYFGLYNGQEPRKSFHRRMYGDTVTYRQLAPLFRAELFDPASWASLFERAGAKYVVLTSKHHDGYALWPSTYSPGWNAGDVGPGRDLVSEVTEAVRDQGLKMGLYYSLMEWTNPLFTWEIPRAENDKTRYIDEHMLPQMRELVDRYTPSIFWADGEWTTPSDSLRSEEFVSWLFNHTDVRDEIVVNDRWGNDTRFKHGSFFATEYTDGLDDTDHAWEECRGIGRSFGYNRNEESVDYKTAKELIHMLIRLVSNGGNLLLNVGPMADGRIPEIMQDRLMIIGEWLRTNGEAIYGTRKFAYASKNDSLYYTRSKDGSGFYAISVVWPQDSLHLGHIAPNEDMDVRLLGPDATLAWTDDGNNGTIVYIPQKLRNSFSDAESAAYAIRIRYE